MSFQIHCPECSTAIPPENINVQKTIAACPSCGAVFNFADDVARKQQKIKRRKVQQPDFITQTETEDRLLLEMPLVQSMSNKIGLAIGGLLITGLYAGLLNAMLLEGDVGVAVLFSLILIPIFTGMFGSLMGRQFIESTHNELKHTIKLGVPVYQRKMSIADVRDVTIEETAATRESVAEARYNMFAERIDGREDMFIQNLPEETAFYTQQALSAFVSDQTPLAADRLIDRADDVINYESVADEAAQQSQQQM